MNIEKFFREAYAPVQQLKDEILEKKNVRLYVKRDDLLHPLVSGNKMRKMKYNLIEAISKGYTTILTFGGAYSNHIFATAAAGEIFGLKTIGIIRGEAYEELNPTLVFAQKKGMQLHYINRSEYLNRYKTEFIDNIKGQFGDVYILPEGGSNSLAVKGCAELVDEIEEDFDILTSCSGTGGTISGIIAGLKGSKEALGFPVLKGGTFLNEEIKSLLKHYNGQEYSNWRLETEYHFGGYAKFNMDLIEFINSFKRKHDIQLDPVYTGKMFYGIYNLISAGKINPGTIIMAVHTGGLQGIAGFNERFGGIINDRD